MARKVQFLEVVRDKDLARKEPEVTAAVRRFFPDAPPVTLYRTADGRVGVQLQVSVAAGERKRLQEAYQAAMKALGERRGRPRGGKTVQTKLLLPEPVYRALKRVAADSNATMSSVITDLARRELMGKISGSTVRT